MASPSATGAAARHPDVAGLTGRPGRVPLVPPTGVLERIRRLGRPIDVDPLDRLGDRAAAAGFTRGGATSAGAQARLLPTADGWLAVNLARPDDVDTVPAWLGIDAPSARRTADDGRDGRDDRTWAAVARTVAGRAGAPVAERAALLGLPVAVVGSVAPTAVDDALGGLPVGHTRWLPSPPLAAPPRVLDLSSLWAGPLATRLLADRGAVVTEIDSAGRPDAGRTWPPGFAERLHAGKRRLTLDLRQPAGAQRLRELIDQADVVVEGSRPRALAQLGIDATQLVRRASGPKVWLSLTGYGRADTRVAFGDDAAAAGGLVAWDDQGPMFALDAVADPLSGVAAAAAVTIALGRPGRWLIDVALASVAAFVAGPPPADPWPPASA